MMQQIDVQDSVGKTIKKIYMPNWDNILILVYEDNTFSYIYCTHSYDQVEICNANFSFDDIGDKVVDLGILSDMEYKELITKKNEQRKEKDLKYKKEQLQRLKRELGEL